MAHELTHAEAGELLGAYALDAVDADEREAVERHLRVCDLCRAEVMEHIEVAGLLSSGLSAAPASVWDRISEELEGAPPPLNLAPIHAQRPVAPESTTVGRQSGRPPARRGAGLRIGAMVAATVAASVIGVLGLKVVEDGRRIDSIASGNHADDLQRTIDAAMKDPEVVKVEMRSPDGALFVDAVLLADGRGYLARNNLPVLSAGRSYQMWAVVGDEKISVGVLGSVAEQSAFVASGPVAALAITEESAGGVVASFQQPVVVGAVRQS